MKIKKSINKNTKALAKLLEARVHLGHIKSRWNPKNDIYIHGVRENIHIIDLKESTRLLSRALFLIKDLLKERGRILVFGNTYENALFVRGLGESYKKNIVFYNTKWIGGSLTNRQTVKSTSLNDKLPCHFQKSKLVILLNSNKWVIKEALNSNIPVVGILDSITNPTFYSYPIPGNDDSIPSHFLYCQALSYLLKKSSS